MHFGGVDSVPQIVVELSLAMVFMAVVFSGLLLLQDYDLHRLKKDVEQLKHAVKQLAGGND